MQYVTQNTTSTVYVFPRAGVCSTCITSWLDVLVG